MIVDLFAWSAVLLALVLVSTGLLHIYNVNRVHKKLMKIGHCQTTKEAFFKEMTVAQGSNFTALAFAGWVLIFVSIAYLYFLVPTILPYSYMQVPALISSSMGFGIFGVVIALGAMAIILGLDMLPESCRLIKLTELYSFYTISKGTKRLIGMTVPALCASVVFSAYLGTVYPERSHLAEIFGFMLLAASLIVLVAPIYKEVWKGRR
jgi:hypothetical protein